MKLGFHIANEFDEILLGYICIKYKIFGNGFIAVDTRRNSVNRNRIEIAVKCAILYVPKQFFQISF